MTITHIVSSALILTMRKSADVVDTYISHTAKFIEGLENKRNEVEKRDTSFCPYILSCL